jgi:hypothetical protein
MIKSFCLGAVDDLLTHCHISSYLECDNSLRGIRFVKSRA